MKKQMFPKALRIAEKAHVNQYRKYAVSVLHDSIEEAPEYEKMIRKEFPKKVLEAIKVLTRIKGENYFEYIMCIRDSHDADIISIKVADIKDNLKDHNEGSRKDKYRFSLYVLENAL